MCLPYKTSVTESVLTIDEKHSITTIGLSPKLNNTKCISFCKIVWYDCSVQKPRQIMQQPPSFMTVPYTLGLARYHFFRTDTNMIPKILSICRHRSDTAVFFKSAYHFFISVCVDLLFTLVFFTQSTKYRQLYCKEKQQMNGYVIIIYDKNTFINYFRG